VTALRVIFNFRARADDDGEVVYRPDIAVEGRQRANEFDSQKRVIAFTVVEVGEKLRGT
jgi:hypothetical protein